MAVKQKQNTKKSSAQKYPQTEVNFFFFFWDEAAGAGSLGQGSKQGTQPTTRGGAQGRAIASWGAASTSQAQTGVLGSVLLRKDQRKAKGQEVSSFSQVDIK